jgi:hypothetical protein
MIEHRQAGGESRLTVICNANMPLKVNSAPILEDLVVDARVIVPKKAHCIGCHHLVGPNSQEHKAVWVSSGDSIQSGRNIS